MRACLVAGLLFVGGPALAAEHFIGKWDITLIQGRFTMEGLLEIRSGDGGLVAFVEGGPVRLSVDGDEIAFSMDDRTATGMPFTRYLTGSLSAGAIGGNFGPEQTPPDDIRSLCERLPLACPAPTGTWTAVPHVPPASADLAAAPVDLSGSWVTAVGGVRRLTMDLTEAATEWKAGFDVEMDLPGQRCQSSGLVNGWAFRGNDPEIYQTGQQVTMVLGNEIRRIYLDDRRPPEYTDWYPLGFSSGRWEGSTLVVETTHLQPGVREWNGDPVSEDARVIERYSIDDEGRLVGVMTLHDPGYYKEPPVKRARWRRADESAIRFPVLCDPDSFYRQLYDDGLMDEYWRRSHRRY